MGVTSSCEFSPCPSLCARGPHSSCSNLSCQICESPNGPQPSHRAIVDVAANDSLSHESPNEYTAHTVDDSHLQSVTARLTDCVSTCGGVVVKVVFPEFGILSGLHLCFHHLHQMPRSPHFHVLHLSSASIAEISEKCCPLLPVACQVNVSATSDVPRPGCNSEMALFAAQHSLSHSAFQTPDPRVRTCCSFFNSDCNAGLS